MMFKLYTEPILVSGLFSFDVISYYFISFHSIYLFILFLFLFLFLFLVLFLFFCYFHFFWFISVHIFYQGFILCSFIFYHYHISSSFRLLFQDFFHYDLHLFTSSCLDFVNIFFIFLIMIFFTHFLILLIF